MIHDGWSTLSLFFSRCESKESDIKNLILKYPKETRPDFWKTLSRPLNREKMLLRHVAMVAKFLDDNPIIDLIQFHLICEFWRNFQGWVGKDRPYLSSEKEKAEKFCVVFAYSGP